MRTLAVVFAPLLLPLAAAAVTYHVDGTLPVATCATYEPATRSCGAGTGTAFRDFTPLAGATTTAPGDVILIRGGNYPLTLHPGVSGTVAAPITYAGYPGEVAVITGALDPAINLLAVSFVHVRDLTVRDVPGWVRAEGCSRILIENCVFERAQAGGSRASVKFVNTHDSVVRNCILSDGNDNLQFVHSDRNLAEGNRITLARHNLWSILCGNENVLRRNYFHNGIQKAGQITDCEGVPSDATPSFDDTHRNVIEENEFAFTASSGNSSPYAGIQHAAQESLIRRNVFHDTVGPALDLTLYFDEAQSNVRNRIAHDVFVRSEFAGISLAPPVGGTQFSDNLFINNILADGRFVANDTRWPWYTDVLAGEPVQVLTGRLDGFRFERNNILGDSPGQAHAVTNGHRTRSDNPPGQSLAAWELAEPALFSGNLEVDPQFVDAAGDDFHLQATSPLIDAGTFLTVATSSGSGTTLPVQDALWFTAGLPLVGVEGDLIQLAGTITRARVVAVDLALNELTLDAPLAWTAGQGVTWAFEGTAPDVGAYENGPCAAGIPAEALDLRWSSVNTLAWQGDVAEPSAMFDLRRGLLSDLHATRLHVLVCLAGDLALPTAVDVALPGAGAAFYYLVLPVTCAGAGGLGRDSQGSLRRDSGLPCP